MSAMRAIELPELPAPDLQEEPAAAQQETSAATRAAALWTGPAPMAPATPAAPTAPAAPTTPTAPAAPTAPAVPGAPSAAPARPARRQPPRAQVADPPLRLTRRGKIVVAVAAGLLAAGLSMVIAASAQATSHSPGAAQQGLAKVTVRPGQSLWSVAESADPGADTRSVIAQIIELNGLSADTVMPGQSLWVPRG
ncbi:MAG: LysM peptidoglycan-binding domain-containing protein [Streptosporangiaceae bacterium]